MHSLVFFTSIKKCVGQVGVFSVFKIIDYNFKNKVTSLSNKWTNEIGPASFLFSLTAKENDKK